MALTFRPMFMLCFLAITICTVNGSSQPCLCKVKYSKVGCYRDPGSFRDGNRRHLPELLLNWRDRVEWGPGWHDFLKDLTCRCAELAKENGYTYYGIQYYGECWSGEISQEIFETKKSNRCWGYRPNYETCEDDSPNQCVGEAHHNYIYEVLPEEPEGCTGGQTASTTKKPDPCDSRPCQNGGECLGSERGGYVCECPDEYHGRNCESPKF